MVFLFNLIGILTVVAGILFMLVAKGGIHEATAAILWCGGFGIMGMAAILAEVRRR